MGIQVYNTMTRRREIFRLIGPGKVGMYHCGSSADALREAIRQRGYEVEDAPSGTVWRRTT
ncbi:MAG: hypothetical protein SWK90_03050 [Chloroflexota bacterium]|nr:hypothetical protein [Chloroflexota bacterium]